MNCIAYMALKNVTVLDLCTDDPYSDSGISCQFLFGLYMIVKTLVVFVQAGIFVIEFIEYLYQGTSLRMGVKR